jgi:peroxiredoxin
LATQGVKFRAAGVRLVGISPDTAEELAQLRREADPGFPLISDGGEELVTALCGGLEHCQILLDARGAIRWGEGTESWRAAPPPEDLLAAARRLD